MKIVSTLEEAKDILAEYAHKHHGGEKPTVVRFVHQYSDGGETDVGVITQIHHIEVVFPSKPGATD